MKTTPRTPTAGPRKALLIAFCALAVSALAAEWTPANFQVQPYALDTGVYANRSTNEVVAFSSSIQAVDRPSKLRVHFSSFNLGKRSYLTLVSVRDGGKQKLDPISIGYWQSTSALFN